MRVRLNPTFPVHALDFANGLAAGVAIDADVRAFEGYGVFATHGCGWMGKQGELERDVLGHILSLVSCGLFVRELKRMSDF